MTEKLQDDTSITSAALPSSSSVVSIRSIPASSRLLLLVHLGPIGVFGDDLRAEVVKHFVDVAAQPSRCLVVGFLSPLLGQLEGSSSGHYPLVFHVGFVANHHQRNILIVLDADDLFSQLGELIKGVHVADGEDEEEALALSHVEFSHRGELFGASRV